MPNAKQFTVYSDTTTKCKQHFTRYNVYCKLIGIILFKTVRAFGFKIEPSLITCCYNFVKILILKKSLCFPQVGWNACGCLCWGFFYQNLQCARPFQPLTVAFSQEKYPSFLRNILPIELGARWKSY